jgi:hypothetical protein
MQIDPRHPRSFPPGRLTTATVPALALVLLLVWLATGCSTVPSGAATTPTAAPEPAPSKPTERSEPPVTAFERMQPAPVALEPAHTPVAEIVDLSRLRVGMTKAQVRAIFPDPEEIDISPRGREVWNYRFAQLHFRDGRLADWFTIPGADH